MDALLLLTALTTALAVGAFALGIQTSLGATRRVVRARTIGEAVHSEALVEIARRPRSLLVRATRLPFVPSSDQIGLELERAGWSIRVGEYLALRLFVGCLILALGVFVADALGLGGIGRLILGLVGFLFGWILPTRYVAARRERRLRRIEQQLPEALTVMSKSLKVGSGLLQALGYAAEETPAPLGHELRRVLRDLQLGAEPEIVFGELSNRVGSGDLDIVATALIIQRRVGGNLSEILNNVANTVRERQTIQNEVRVLTSRQRLTANLVALLPVVVALGFFAINPDVARLLVDTQAGRIALAIGIFFELFGLWLIRRLAVIEV
jgi:tight adherence protein B